MIRPHQFDCRSKTQGTSLRVTACIGALALLAACATHGPRTSATQEAARYAAHARRNYTPPGPPQDPWGPYIREAAQRFDVPDLWIRSVMRVELGGNEYINGQLVTSSAGAMGLMQVMPDTYDGLRDRHRLGDDPYDPRDNILAGTAYLREMYDIYGSPGFLAAYNAGPRRLDDYLSNNRSLPDETRRYVAMIGPEHRRHLPGEPLGGRGLCDERPADRYSPRDTLWPGHAIGEQPRRWQGSGTPANPVPQLPITSPGGAPANAAIRAGIAATAATARRFSPDPRGRRRANSRRRGGPAGGQWAIQVGAYSSEGLAHAAVGSAREQARTELAVARPFVAGVHQGRAVLYRARLTGLSRETAVQACGRLVHGRMNCVVLSPESQS